MADHDHDDDGGGDDGRPGPDPAPPSRSIDSPWYVRLTPADMGLLRRAARQRWGVPDEIKSLALLRLGEILARGEESRESIAAARTLAAMDRIDLQSDALDLAREAQAAKTARPEAEITLSDLVAEAEAAAEAHDRETTADRPPGAVP